MRTSAYRNLSPSFIERWSPRAFSDKDLTEDELMTLFEAARWAPSCYNEQPWRFIYAHTNETKDEFAKCLMESNRIWAKNAPVLAMCFSRIYFTENNKPNRWGAFDCGAAWMSLALQAHAMGLVTHAMGGFDEDLAYQVTGVNPKNYVPLAAIAIGHPGDSAKLAPGLREREMPSERKALDEIAYELKSKKIKKDEGGSEA